MYYISHTILTYDSKAKNLYFSIFTFSLIQLFFTIYECSWYVISFLIAIHGKYTTSHENIYCFPYIFFFSVCKSKFHFCMFTANVGIWTYDHYY